MKLNWIVVIFVFVLVTAFNLSDKLGFNSPSVKIESKTIMNTKSGKVICYTINVFSSKDLNSLIIEPGYKKDANSHTNFVFESHVRKATISYYYELPEKYSDEDIKMTFKLKDKEQTITKVDFVKF